MPLRNFIFTSESVTEGHPDKMADQISDAVLDAMIGGDPHSRVACETLLTTGLVVVAGEITANTIVDLSNIVRKTITEIGYTDSAITGMEDESVVGNEAPLVSQNTANAGAQYTVPVGGLDLMFRVDYRHTGRTWWDPYNSTSRDPVDIVDARVALGADRWRATLWGRNITDEKYNAEFSPGGFLFKALPIRYGIEFEYTF